MCAVVAELCRVPFIEAELPTGPQRRRFLTKPPQQNVFHFTPTQGSWLNQAGLWFRVLGRRFPKRGDFHLMAEFEMRLLAFLDDHIKRHAHSYSWIYSKTPLVRGTPFSQTRRQ
jgi:hypothetical protein